MNAKERIEFILLDAGVSMLAKHVPTDFDPKSKEWQHIAWTITIKSSRGEFNTTYKQGLGHLPNWKPKYDGFISIDDAAIIAFTLRTGLVKDRPGMFMKHGKPLPPPHIADVVSSLIGDASAADYANFEEWADDMGMNPDSRKDFAIWEACRDIALELNRVLGAKVVEALREPCSEL